MLRQRLIVSLVVCFILSCAFLNAAMADTAQVVELEATLQNSGIYTSLSCDVTESTFDLNINIKNKTTNGHVLRFGDIGRLIRGKKIEIIEARLELYYEDESWSKIKYHVAAHRSLDGTAEKFETNPEGFTYILGDKWPIDKKTPRPSWVSIPISNETIRLWMNREEKNKGLVLFISRIEGGKEQNSVDLELVKSDTWPLFVKFRSCNNLSDQKTPRLIIRYRVFGNAPPSPPRLNINSTTGKIYKKATIAWQKSTDPNKDDKIHYEFEVGYKNDNDIIWKNATVQVNGSRAIWMTKLDRDRIYSESTMPKEKQLLWYRVRAVDSSRSTSGWSVAGPYQVTDKLWEVWGTHGNRKIWNDIKQPVQNGNTIRIKAARNEWEPLQVVIKGYTELHNIKITASKLTNSRGHTIGAPIIFHQHYIPIVDTSNKKYGHLGMVPDALVPLIHPDDAQSTSGQYGGSVFNINMGGQLAYWLDIFVNEKTPPGIYNGIVKVSATDAEDVILPVELEVFNFRLPQRKHLIAMFQLNSNSVNQSHSSVDGNKLTKRQQISLARKYESMLHEHYINNWSPITGFNYGLNGVKVNIYNGKVHVDWQRYDELIKPYMDGSAYRDKVPAQTLFVPYWIPVKNAKGNGWARRVNRYNYNNINFELFGQYIKEVQRHFKEMGWLDRAYVFYFDEPFISKWKYKAFIQTSKIIRQEAPELKILITDGYKGTDEYKKIAYISDSIEKYVDVWDPVTFQVSSPELVDYYRTRKAEGKFDIWCQTLANANPRRAVINLFPEYDMPFHRMWGVMSWNFGFQGIEWWETIIWWDNRTKKRLDPWTDPQAFPGYNQPLNSDGRLFFPGTPHAIGGTDIPISTLRMKAVREAIEDYEYLYLLDQLGSIKDFSIDMLHTTDKHRSKQMKMPMPMGKGPWQWWEGDPDRMMQIREKLARLIERYNMLQ